MGEGIAQLIVYLVIGGFILLSKLAEKKKERRIRERAREIKEEREPDRQPPPRREPSRTRKVEPRRRPEPAFIPEEDPNQLFEIVETAIGPVLVAREPEPEPPPPEPPPRPPPPKPVPAPTYARPKPKRRGHRPVPPVHKGGPFDRFAGRPRIQQAILMSEILGTPRGLQPPGTVGESPRTF